MIAISSSLKSICPNIKCHFLSGTIDNSANSEIVTLLEDIAANEAMYNTDIPEIQLTREAYKSCGKEPSRYRPSAEALRRRIRTGKGLYSISAAVDIINIVSITSGISIGGYDYDLIRGNVTAGIGSKHPYDAIGRGELNIEYLPCLYDDLGPFGSPTSDSTRTMITINTRRLLMVFYDFENFSSLDQSMGFAKELLQKYCNFKPL